MSRPYRYGCAVLLLAVALGLLGATRQQLLRAMARWTDVGERPRPADYVMVLNGGEETRPFAAAALVKAGFARHVLVAATAVSPNVKDRIIPPYHEINHQVLLKRGIPASVTSPFCRGRPQPPLTKPRRWPLFSPSGPTPACWSSRATTIRGEVVGSSPEHWPTGSEQVTFVSAPTDRVPHGCWWQDEEGFVTILSEYLKLAFYVVRYGHFSSWLAACLALVLVGHWIRRRQPVSPSPA